MMVILFAGLQASRAIRRGCQVFGAGFFQRVRHVIFPMLKPSIQVALLLRLIFAFEVFAVVIALTGSGATVLAAEAYKWQATNQNEHVAAAYSVVILGLSLVAAAVVLWRSARPGSGGSGDAAAANPRRPRPRLYRGAGHFGLHPRADLLRHPFGLLDLRCRLRVPDSSSRRTSRPTR